MKLSNVQTAVCAGLGALLCATSIDAQVIRTNQGFHSYSVDRNDDGSSDLTPLGFTINFFGKIRNSVYVNNNGNITFDDALATYTPFGLQMTSREIIAPYFADVDTRGARSNLVTYGQDTVNGHKAFAANFVDVGYFKSHDDKLNRFQVVVIDRSDTGAGNFTIEFNYEKVVWETGDASGGLGGFGGVPATVGWSNGTTDFGTSFELPGSMVAGAFLDSGPRALVRAHVNTAQVGRIIFQARDGVISPGLAIQGGPILPDGTISQPYAFGYTATGVDSAVKWDLVPDVMLPPGLQFANGRITGRPTTAGTYTFTVSASATVEGEPVTINQRGSVTIGVPTLSIQTGCPVPAGTVGEPYSTSFTTIGNLAANWSVDDRNALPPGVTLSPSGLLSGAPALAGNFSFVVGASSTNGTGALPASKICTMMVKPATVSLVNGCALPDATVGVPYSQTLIPSGGVAPFRFTVNGKLPLGLSLSSDGRVAGLPLSAEYGPFDVQITDSRSTRLTQSCSINVADPSIKITTGCPLPRTTTGSAYSAALRATGGSGSYSWSVSGGSLPPGLSLDSGSAVAGTPMAAGPFTFRLVATDSTGKQAGLACSLPVVNGPLGVSGCPLPEATVGDSYQATLRPAGGSEPFAWNLTGSLPPGLQLTSAGVVLGRVTTAGDYQFGISLTDRSSSVSEPCSMKVKPLALRMSSVAPSPAGRIGETYSTRFTAAGGTPPYRFAFFGYLPDGLTGTGDGTLSGIPTKAGTTSFGIRATDSAGATAQVTSSIEIGLPIPPSVRITTPAATVAQASADLKIAVDLDRAYTLPITGQLVLTLAPDTQSAGGSANQPDPHVRFPNGQLTTAFQIPAGGAHAEAALLSTGTVATTITASVRNLQAGGVDFVSPVISWSFRVPAVGPVLNSACFVKTDYGTQITALGSSSTRELVSAEVGAGGISRTTDLNGASTDYFSDEGTIRFGGAFSLQFDADSVFKDANGPFTVRLANRVGVSATLTAQPCR